MTLTAIEAQEVWKQLKIPHERRSTILENIAGVLSVLDDRRYSYEQFWAIKDVSFRLKTGIRIGIVGPNGSGKSTLLKLIARTMKPDGEESSTTVRWLQFLNSALDFKVT